MEIDDIYGVRSKRLYRGPTKDIFKVENIHDAHPHKVARSPRKYAFDDYKDVTSAQKYRRPFVNSSQSIHSQYLDSNPSPAPVRTMPKGNYKVPEDLYQSINYYNLPRVSPDPFEFKETGPFPLKSSFKSYTNNTRNLNRNHQSLTFDNSAIKGFNPGGGFYTQRSNQNPLEVNPDFEKQMAVFYGTDAPDALDKEVLKTQFV